MANDANLSRREFFLIAGASSLALTVGCSRRQPPLREGPVPIIDAHAHVWSDDNERYPIAAGMQRPADAPAAFTTDHMFRHMHSVGVSRANLIQISFYGFDNTYMLEAIAQSPHIFVGTAVIDPFAENIEATMSDLHTRGVRAFRIHPRLSKQPPASWLRPDGYRAMFAEGARKRQAMSCLIDPDALLELDRMCTAFPDTPVIIDHLCRIGADGNIREADGTALCAMARHRNVNVKVGAFYALGRKTPPYEDLGPMIRRVVEAFTPERCMWESDSPFQVQGVHTYAASIEMIRTRLDFLTASEKESLLGKTADRLLFAP